MEQEPVVEMGVVWVNLNFGNTKYLNWIIKVSLFTIHCHVIINIFIVLKLFIKKFHSIF